MRFSTAVAAAALVTTLSGCSIFMRSIEKPTATVRDVSVSTVSFAGATGKLSLDVMNPNSVGVPLSGIDWQLSIGGSRAVTGTVQLSQTIPAKGVAPIETTLSIAARDAIVVAGVLASGARDYRVDVTLHFSTQVGQIDVAVNHTGELGSSLASR
jgi:LEA14-like dessication related protein